MAGLVDTVDVRVKRGVVYRMRKEVSVGVALEYIRRFVDPKAGEGAVNAESQRVEGAEGTEKEAGTGAFIQGFLSRTAANMDDLEFLFGKVLVGRVKEFNAESQRLEGAEGAEVEAWGPEMVIPIADAYQLLPRLREAIGLEGLLDIVAAQSVAADPDFPEEPEKN